MEQWKDIPGYEELYQASTYGRIRTCEGKVTSNARYPHRVWEQRIMKQKYQERKTGTGFDARVTLWKDGREHTYLVSRLIALTWCDGFSEEMTVNHIDGNPMNNHSDNLEWVTRAENIRKSFDNTSHGAQTPTSLIDQGGQILSFPSMSSASRYLGKNSHYISGLLARGKTYLSNGYTIVTAEASF